MSVLESELINESDAALSADYTEITMTSDKGRGVFALKAFSPNEIVIVGKPVELVPERSMYSIQIGWDQHANFNEPAILLNHSCDPNCGIKDNAYGGYDFIAMRPIAKGEEITWDYCMSEYISIAVSDCLCGTDPCRGKITGYKYLPEDVKRRYAGFCAGYLNR